MRFTLGMFGTAQYDFLFIANDTVIHIDIKNYSGLYRFDNSNFIREQGYVHLFYYGGWTQWANYGAIRPLDILFCKIYMLSGRNNNYFAHSYNHIIKYIKKKETPKDLLCIARQRPTLADRKTNYHRR